MVEKRILSPVTDKHLHAALCFSSWSFKADTHNLAIYTQPQKPTKKCDMRWKMISQISLCTDLVNIFLFFLIIFFITYSIICVSYLCLWNICTGSAHICYSIVYQTILTILPSILLSVHPTQLTHIMELKDKCGQQALKDHLTLI